MPQAQFGIATLNRDEYECIRVGVSDPHNLPPDFDAWLELSQKIKQAHERMGSSTRVVHVDLAALVAYRRGERPSAADLSKYANQVATGATDSEVVHRGGLWPTGR
jgi:hypothetical protein